jgi:hypothetical protein
MPINPSFPSQRCFHNSLCPICLTHPQHPCTSLCPLIQSHLNQSLCCREEWELYKAWKQAQASKKRRAQALALWTPLSSAYPLGLKETLKQGCGPTPGEREKGEQSLKAPHCQPVHLPSPQPLKKLAKNLATTPDLPGSCTMGGQHAPMSSPGTISGRMPSTSNLPSLTGSYLSTTPWGRGNWSMESPCTLPLVNKPSHGQLIRHSLTSLPPPCSSTELTFKEWDSLATLEYMPRSTASSKPLQPSDTSIKSGVASTSSKMSSPVGGWHWTSPGDRWSPKSRELKTILLRPSLVWSRIQEAYGIE